MWVLEGGLGNRQTRAVMERLLARHRKGVLHKRGISDHVIDGAPMRYTSFKRSEWDAFLYFMEWGWSMPKAKRPVWKGKVSQSGGVVIRRFAGDGTKRPPYARFDAKVAMGVNQSTNYIYPPGKHIDIHPLAAARFADADELYFCLEGSLKADAVLSAGGTCFSSSSVTMWESADLRRLLNLLRDVSIVYVVPDSDYYASPKYGGSFNPMVVWQTRAAAQWLGSFGVRTAIRVPWLGRTIDKVGVDDYLALGHPLEELAWGEPRHAPVSVTGYGLTRSHERVLRWLLDSQGSYGSFYPGHVGKVLGINHKTVTRAYQSFEDKGVMRVWQGKRVNTPEGPRSEPHTFRLTEAVDQSYKAWLDSLPVSHSPGPTPISESGP